jgi:ATP-dependent phosphoenolpyruvate carboxykinase
VGFRFIARLEGRVLEIDEFAAERRDGATAAYRCLTLGVPLVTGHTNDAILKPRKTWSDKEAFDVAARKLVQMFRDNFAKFESVVQADVMAIAMSA